MEATGVKFSGSSYGEVEEYEVPAGHYNLENGFQEFGGDQVMLYRIENRDEGWSLQAWVPDIPETPKCEVPEEEVRIQSGKDDLEGITYDAFLEFWNDLKSSEDPLNEIWYN